MTKIWAILTAAFALAVLFVLSAHYLGGSGDITSEPNDAGLPGEPTRIVALAPNLTEILFELGLGEKVVAVSSDSDYPAEAADKRKVGTFWQPNVEAVIAAKPDLVVTLSFAQQKAAAQTLNRLGLKVLTVKIEKIEDLLAAIGRIAVVAGRRQQGQELLDRIKMQMDDLKSKFSSTRRARVLWVVQAEPLRVASANTFINELIELAGGENAIGRTISQYPQIGTEELLACGPEVIIQSAMSKSDIGGQQRNAEVFWSKWPTLPAVKDKRIYVVESGTVLRLGPRLCTAIELIGRCLHPAGPAREQNAEQQVKLTDD